MASTTHEPLPTDLRPSQHAGAHSNEWHNSAPSGDLRTTDAFSPPPAGTAVWVAIAAITMFFAAFTSALVVRKGGAPDWRHLTLPAILYANTAVLLASSFTLHAARKRVGAFMSGKAASPQGPARWLQATLALGLLFVAGQFVAWLQLRSQGLYLASSPNSSFFYVFTTLHAVHVLGGLVGLFYIIHRFNNRSLRKSSLDAASYYWHFMDVLWLYLLFVLWSKI
jgi:cytochrome c oxidase subunit 3